jgi:hypothetical protein
MPLRLFPLISLLCLSTAVLAQSERPARYQIYGGYAYLSNTMNGVPGSRHALNGWDASVGFPAWHSLRFKIDVASFRGSNLGAPQNPLSIMGGGQYGWHVKRESVFVEGLVGNIAMNEYWGASGTRGGTASFAALLGGGLDTPITRRIAFRVSGGYQYSYFALVSSMQTGELPYRIPGLPTNFGRISSGLVWKF